MNALNQKERDEKFGLVKKWYCPDCGEELVWIGVGRRVCPLYGCVNGSIYDSETGEQIDD